MSKDAISILIADDHHVVRTGLRIALNSGHHEVIGEAENGKATIEQAALLSPDVILMDLGMPVMDGIAATQKIKSQFPLIRVLIVSANQSETQVLAALSSGADGYCLKESSTEQLKLAIDAIYSGAAWFDARIGKTVLKFLQTDSAATNQTQSQPALSPRETEVLKLIIEGLSNQEIADRLYLGVDTIKTHVRTLMKNLAVHDRTQAAVKAIRKQLI